MFPYPLVTLNPISIYPSLYLSIYLSIPNTRMLMQNSIHSVGMDLAACKTTAGNARNVKNQSKGHFIGDHKGIWGVHVKA